MKGRSSVLRNALAIAGAAALAAGLFIGIRLLFSTVPLVPGVAGCSYLGDYDDRVGCMQERLLDSSEDPDPLKAMRQADDELQGDPTGLQECHEAAHVVARRVVKATEEDAISLLDGPGRELDECSFGFIHGVVEESVRLQPATFRELATTGCRKLPNDQRQENCIHGVGHGLLRSGMDVDVVRVRCSSLQEKVSEVHCLMGMYMEETFDLERSIESLCVRLPDDEQQLCGYYLPLAGASRDVAGDSTADVLRWCSTLDQGDEVVAGCIRATLEQLPSDERSTCDVIDHKRHEATCRESVGTFASVS